MNNHIILLFGLFLILIILKIKNIQAAESFKSCKNCNLKNNISPFVDFSNWSYQPSKTLKDDVTINLPKLKCDNTLHHNLHCKNCYIDNDGKWSCNQCRKNKEQPSEFQSRYLRAMAAIKKITNALNNGSITTYTYHNLINKWLQTYYDVTLLPKDKIDQLICASYLSIIDESSDKTKYEDFIANTWPNKCSSKIPSILYGEVDNVIDISDPESIENNIRPDQQNIEELINSINNKEYQENKKKEVDISEFRDQFNKYFK